MKILNSDSPNPTKNKSLSSLRPQLNNRTTTIINSSSVVITTTTIKIMIETLATAIDNKSLTAKTVVTEATDIKTTEAPITNMAIEMRRGQIPTKKVATDKTVVVTGKITRKAVKALTTAKIETHTTREAIEIVITKNASISLKLTPTPTTDNSTAMTPISS
jgi:hypothetical protein